MKNYNILDESLFLNSANELYLSPDEVKKIRELHDVEDIIKVLGAIVDKIPYPFSNYTPSQLNSDFNALKNSHLEIVKGEWVSHRLNDQIDLFYDGECIRFPKAKNAGSKVSNQETERMRLSTPTRYPSLVDLWGRERKYWLKYLFNPKMWNGEVTVKKLKTAIQGQHYASQFKPLIAKSLYDAFGAKNVLDFSAGWGDRLVGFLASDAESYIGIDPSTQLHEPYQKIVDFCNTGKPTRFICSPAEDVDFTQLKYDFVFTSPPYFTIEKYSQEETQSWKRYPEINLWLEGFLFPTLKNIYESLDEGGRMVVNINDVFTGTGKKEICLPMLKYMESLGVHYEGVIGYEMSHRSTGSVESHSMPFCEPMFVWSKGEVSKPNWNPYLFFGV
jgi:hypothetical protein